MAEEPEKKQQSTAAGVGCLVVIVVVVVLIIIGAVSGGSDSSDDADSLKYGAFDVCTQFVKERLKSQSTAEFPDPTEDDGEVLFSHSGDVWTVTSQVDAQNGFGAMLTIPFTCEVRHTSGENWRLVDLSIEE